jgi:hypothetical protein
MTNQEILAGRGAVAENDGILGPIVYGNVDGTMQTVLSYTGTGPVPDTLAWLTGAFTGSGQTQIAQPWVRVLS